METNLQKHATKHANIYAHELDLTPKHPVFPPDYLEDEKYIFLDPVPTYIKVSNKEFSHVEVDIKEGNAPCQVCFLTGEGQMEKDFVWIGESKSIKIPYTESGVCDLYFLRKLNKGFCKGNYKFTKE